MPTDDPLAIEWGRPYQTKKNGLSGVFQSSVRANMRGVWTVWSFNSGQGKIDRFLPLLRIQIIEVNAKMDSVVWGFERPLYGNSSGSPEMKVMLTCLHNRTWNPRSGSYCGTDPGPNGSEKVGSVAGMRKMRSPWVKGPPSQYAIFANQALWLGI